MIWCGVACFLIGYITGFLTACSGIANMKKKEEMIEDLKISVVQCMERIDYLRKQLLFLEEIVGENRKEQSNV